MTYTIDPLSVDEFVDPNLRLPRFQRNTTWGPKKNFELAMSVFMGLPLGMVVVKEVTNDDGIVRRYLLDGRQRLTAFQGMYDPETIYSWAVTVLGIKKTQDERSDVRDRFFRFVEQFLGQEDLSDSDEEDGDEEDDDDFDFDHLEGDFSEVLGEDLPAIYLESVSHEPQAGLGQLATILQVVHGGRGAKTGFNEPFDFHDVAEGSFLNPHTSPGRWYVDTSELLDWLRAEMSRSARRPGVPQLGEDPDFFAERLCDSLRVADERALKRAVNQRWEDIRPRLGIVALIDSKLKTAKLGHLQVKDTSPVEDQKIFHLINTSGTPLTAEEILSARPEWNQLIETPTSQVRSAQQGLYESFGIRPVPTDVVYWDEPATLMIRCDAPLVFGPNASREVRVSKRRLSLGFRRFAGHYLGQIDKDDITRLPRVAADELNRTVPWGSGQLAQKIEAAEAFMAAMEPFRRWRDWQRSVAELTSRNVALNLLLCTLEMLDAENNPQPRSNSSAARRVQRSVKSLFDRSLYEYLVGRWRSASDSRIAENLKSARAGHGAVFDQVPREAWGALMIEMVDHGTIDGRSYTGAVRKPARLVLTYVGVLAEKHGPRDPNDDIEFDHLIPETEFEAARRAPSDDLDPRCNRILNLTALPSSSNRLNLNPPK